MNQHTHKTPRRRIARSTFTPRKLDAFEEHTHQSGRPGIEIWRNIGNPNLRVARGKYWCLDCGEKHWLPHEGRALKCPHLPRGEALTRAAGYVELKLARATGQTTDVERELLADLAYEMWGWHWCNFGGWGIEFLGRYVEHARLNQFFRRHEPIPKGHNRQTSPEQDELIISHLPFVRKHARKRATTVWDQKGWLAVNDSLYSDLEEIGVRVLEAAVHRFDPTRGVSFGAFVRKRVAGAMDDFLARERLPTVGGNALDGIVPRAAVERTSAPPKRHRTSTGGFPELAYISTSVPPTGILRLIPADPLSFSETMNAALARLNHRQREVYRGRVLSDPQVSRRELAARLGIRDERQIRRIEQQARRKMAKLLKLSPP